MERTPAEITAEVEGRAEWMRTQAWLTALWSRAKRLPSLNKALGRRPSATAEQARNDYLELSRRADVIQRGQG